MIEHSEHSLSCLCFIFFFQKFKSNIWKISKSTHIHAYVRPFTHAKLLFQAGIKLYIKGDEPCHSDDDMVSFGSDDELEREEELEDSEYKVAAHLKILDLKPPIMLREPAEQEAVDISELTDAFTKLAAARKLQAKANNKIAAVLCRNPSLSSLAQALEPVNIQTPYLPLASHFHLPATKRGTPQVMSVVDDNPVRAPDGIKFACHYCKLEFGSWDSADSHTRKTHTGVKYGPCPHCWKWSSFSAGSFRGHKIMCASLAKRKGRFASTEEPPTKRAATAM